MPSKIHPPPAGVSPCPIPSGSLLRLVLPVVIPFFYPSIGCRLAQTGCFEMAEAAPSEDER